MYKHPFLRRMFAVSMLDDEDRFVFLHRIEPKPPAADAGDDDDDEKKRTDAARAKHKSALESSFQKWAGKTHRAQLRADAARKKQKEDFDRAMAEVEAKRVAELAPPAPADPDPEPVTSPERAAQAHPVPKVPGRSGGLLSRAIAPRLPHGAPGAPGATLPKKES